MPKDDWGNEYVYKQPGQHNEYGFDLYSLGPDEQQGTDDDITNWSQDD
jgi:general secretion pathway protein G